MEHSKVYFCDFRATYHENLQQKLTRLLKTAGMGEIDFDKKFTAIKIHFGEPGNLAFLRPNWAKTVADFVRERGQQTGQLFGIIIHPERWQFMRLQPADDSAPAAADDRWGNAQWLPLQAGRVATAETLPRARLTLRFPDGQAWTPGEQPDVLIFPGGEVTPFQLRIDAATGINVDAQGDSQPLAAREQP